MEGPMTAAYVAGTAVTAFACAFAAYMNFVRHESVIAVADAVQVPRSWMLPLGTLLAAAAVGLLLGFAVPLIERRPRSALSCTSSAPRRPPAGARQPDRWRGHVPLDGHHGSCSGTGIPRPFVSAAAGASSTAWTPVEKKKRMRAGSL